MITYPQIKTETTPITVESLRLLGFRKVTTNWYMISEGCYNFSVRFFQSRPPELVFGKKDQPTTNLGPVDMQRLTAIFNAVTGINLHD